MPGITVGIDGSPHSAYALEWALKEAATRHCPLTVLTVHTLTASGWTGHPVALPQDAGDTEHARRAADEMTAKALTQLGDTKPPTVTVRAVSGYPATELINASHDADLMVVGSRGAGGFARLLLGSVSSQVIHHAHCPVVMVPSER